MPGFDVAIVGSTALAGLLAGQMAHAHGKRVLRIGRRASPQRLPRRIDIALPLATRVETWDILARGAVETRALISRIGAPDAVIPVNASLRADTAAGAAALAHLVHIAAGYGLKVRGADRNWTFEAVPLLQPERIEDKVAAWLSAAGARSTDPDSLKTEFDGTTAMTFRAGEETFEAELVVLADDGAILDLPEDQRPVALTVEPMTATLLGKMKSLSAQVLSFVDRGVRLQQRSDGSVLALVDGEAELEGRLASTVPGPFPVPRLATGRSRRVVTADGAPSFARIGESNVRVVAGLGDAAAFFAPALARHLAGAADERERTWFTAHESIAERERVAEFVA
jgi:hypothetical protein